MCNVTFPIHFSSSDINECSVSNGQCDHTCHNTNGSYHCTCNEGYLLLEDMRGCTGRCGHDVCGCGHDVCGYGHDECGCGHAVGVVVLCVGMVTI